MNYQLKILVQMNWNNIQYLDLSIFLWIFRQKQNKL